MTLQELYDEIGGDYEQATRVLRVDKLYETMACLIKETEGGNRIETK